jgi:aminoglycoside phosphotransferase (APT) family kinase protein
MAIEKAALSQSFQYKIEKYLAKILGVNELRVNKAEKLRGGLSREAWRIDTSWPAADGIPKQRSFFLQLDQTNSLIQSGRRIEYAMYKSFWNVPDIPVPEPVCVEDDPEPLGAPFLVTGWLEGDTDPSVLLSPDYKEAGPRLARQSFELLGRIAAIDYRELNLEGVVAAPKVENAWTVELDYWEKIIHDHDIGPLPIISAVIRRLRREAPPNPKRLVVVHGDYRIGNYMFNPDSGIMALLDWEMAHLGDPLEDLAWAFLKHWRFGCAPDKITAFLVQEEAVSIWEKASGLEVENEALRWWTVFNYVKLAGIIVRGAYNFMNNTPKELSYATAYWRCAESQNLWILDEMGVGTS